MLYFANRSGIDYAFCISFSYELFSSFGGGSLVFGRAAILILDAGNGLLSLDGTFFESSVRALLAGSTGVRLSGIGLILF